VRVLRGVLARLLVVALVVLPVGFGVFFAVRRLSGSFALASAVAFGVLLVLYLADTQRLGRGARR
jgi:hypothetical protein